jgi:hypothetical protein
MKLSRLNDGTAFYGQLREIAHDRDENKVQCHQPAPASAADFALNRGNCLTEFASNWATESAGKDLSERAVVPKLAFTPLVEPLPEFIADLAVVGKDRPGVVDLVGGRYEKDVARC